MDNLIMLCIVLPILLTVVVGGIIWLKYHLQVKLLAKSEEEARETIRIQQKGPQEDDVRQLISESREEEGNLNFEAILDKLEQYSSRAQATFLFRLVVMLPIDQIDNLEKYTANRRAHDEKQTAGLRKLIKNAAAEIPKKYRGDRSYNTPEAYNESVV